MIGQLRVDMDAERDCVTHMMSWSQATRLDRALKEILLDTLPLFICIVRSGNRNSKNLFQRPINGPCCSVRILLIYTLERNKTHLS